MNRIKLLTLTWLFSITSMAQVMVDEGTKMLYSPNESVFLWFSIEGGRPCYSVSYKQQPVVKKSY